jgi:hypothetical protein
MEKAGICTRPIPFLRLKKINGFTRHLLIGIPRTILNILSLIISQNYIMLNLSPDHIKDCYSTNLAKFSS